MNLKDKILLDLAEIKNPSLLIQIFEYIQQIKEEHSSPTNGNKSEVLKFAGKITSEEAKEIQDVIDSEFNSIEGEW